MGDRQEDREYTTPAWLTLNIYGSAQIADDPLHDRKPKPGTRTGLLGREEWLENALERIRFDSDTRIPNEQAYVLSGQQRCSSERVRVYERQ